MKSTTPGFYDINHCGILFFFLLFKCFDVTQSAFDSLSLSLGTLRQVPPTHYLGQFHYIIYGWLSNQICVSNYFLDNCFISHRDISQFSFPNMTVLSNLHTFSCLNVLHHHLLISVLETKQLTFFLIFCNSAIIFFCLCFLLNNSWNHLWYFSPSLMTIF